MAACCLCKKDVKSDKKKRKLHNEACREEKKLLEQFLQTSIAKELSDFEETKGEDAWLCYNCQSELNAAPSYKKDFQLVMDCLREAKVFNHVANRVYNTHAFTRGHFQQVDLSRVTDWLRTLYRKL